MGEVPYHARGGSPFLLQSYLSDAWSTGDGKGQALANPVDGGTLGYVAASQTGIGDALQFAREYGGPALRVLSFAARGELLARIAEILQARRDVWYDIARANSGNTRADAAIDIDGAIATLKYYAKLGSSLGGATMLADGPAIRLGRDPNYQGRHVGAPLRGVAIHINAYNFPAWGLWGKAAVALLAGMPVLAKPATATAWLAEEMVRVVVDAGILPPGALSLLCGTQGDLIDSLGYADVVAFTGSAHTGELIRARLAGKGVRLNVEADSLNSALLFPESGLDSKAFALCASEVVKEMTSKAGQKCTAIRRVLISSRHAEAFAAEVLDKLSSIRVGDPVDPEVGMGPLVSMSQREDVEAGIKTLSACADVLTPASAGWAKGAFVAPTLLRAQPNSQAAVHDIEVFGPVATVIPYGTLEEAFSLARRGRGSLVCSVYADGPDSFGTAVSGLADSHGRLLLVDPAIGESHSGHGIVLPSCLHGGPGRAGDGAELGGLRGLWFYHQRSAVQASGVTLSALSSSLAETAGL
jgi:3,4-dehydroadipyl-CoA semialdehyde dehydrogenase